jgi:hypothetical protein
MMCRFLPFTFFAPSYPLTPLFQSSSPIESRQYPLSALNALALSSTHRSHTALTAQSLPAVSNDETAYTPTSNVENHAANGANCNSFLTGKTAHFSFTLSL